jgi:hypothetical protein
LAGQWIGVGRSPIRFGGNGVTANSIVLGGSLKDGNEIYNVGCGTAGADIVIQGGEKENTNPTRDFIISYNHLYADDRHAVGSKDDRGIDGIVLVSGVHNVLIEYNTIHSHNNSYGGDPFGEDSHGRKGLGEDGIDIKEDNHDIIVRFNNIYDHVHQSGITVQSDSYNVYIYGNNISNNLWGALHLKDANDGSKFRSNNVSTRNVFFWSNIVAFNKWRGIGIEDNGGDPVKNVKIYNNLFQENSLEPLSSSHMALWIHGYSTNIDIKNNIFLNNRSNNNYQSHAYISAKKSSIISLNSNLFNHDTYNSKSTLFWKDVGYTGVDNKLLGSSNIDKYPGTINGPLDGFSLILSSAVSENVSIIKDTIPSVTILGKTYNQTYSIGLLSTSNWSVVPPQPKFSLRNTSLSWKKGPYINSSSSQELLAPNNVSIVSIKSF